MFKKNVYSCNQEYRFNRENKISQLPSKYWGVIEASNPAVST